MSRLPARTAPAWSRRTTPRPWCSSRSLETRRLHASAWSRCWRPLRAARPLIPSSRSRSSETPARAGPSRRRSRRTRARPSSCRCRCSSSSWRPSAASFVATGLPYGLGLTAVAATVGLLGPVSHLIPIAQTQMASWSCWSAWRSASSYSMLYVRRERDERAAGRSSRAALEVAAPTSGRAVLNLRADGDGGDVGKCSSSRVPSSFRSRSGRSWSWRSRWWDRSPSHARHARHAW